MSIDELLRSVPALSHAEKFRLARFVLDQLAQDDGVVAELSAQRDETFDPCRYFGVARVSRETVEADLTEVREGWN
jgi:hypothetical protein